MAIVVAGSGEREVRIVVVGRMVVDHIHHHADTGVVKSLHHLFHLADTHCRIGRIGRVRALRRVIVKGIITPVILVRRQIALIHRIIVVGREDMDVSHAQFLKMVDTGSVAEAGACLRFGKGQKFTFVYDTR